MKTQKDFQTKEEYEEYLLFYFSGLAMCGLADRFHGETSCTNAQFSVELAKQLISELKNPTKEIDFEQYFK